jgi:hypothetical protein
MDFRAQKTLALQGALRQVPGGYQRLYQDRLSK